MAVKLELTDIENLLRVKPADSPDGFMTRQQWVEHLGISFHRIGYVLNDLYRKGYVEMMKIPCKNIMGGISMTPVYKINIPSAPKKTRAKARPKTSV